MLEHWQAFLATRTDPVPTDHTGAPWSADATTYLCDLSRLGLIGVAGADAQRFLQSQLTSDANAVDPSRAQLSGYCNPKGRLIASFLLFQCADGYYLQLPQALVERVLRRLQMHVLRAKVAITAAAGAELIRFGLWGPGATAGLSPFLPALPRAPYELVRDANLCAVRLPGAGPRFELIGPLERIQQAWEALADAATVAPSKAWELLDIEAGIPVIHDQTTERFIPQSVNLELTGGVCFTKGCYPGQEVVARLHYLGHPKRRMYRAHLAGDCAPAPGTELHSGPAAGGQNVGRVVNAQSLGGGGVELLVALQTSAFDAGAVHLEDAAGPELSFLSLPYALDFATPE